MMSLFARQASIRGKVNLTLINGEVLEGEIISIGEDFVIIETKKGTAGIYYKMIGVWEILNESDYRNSKELIGFIGQESEITSSEVDALDSEIENLRVSVSEEKTVGKEDESCNLESQIEVILKDFLVKVASAKLVLHRPDMSFPLNGFDSDHLTEDKKQWDKINNQYQHCVKSKNNSLLSSLISELLKFAEKYPDIGVFHYNVACYLANTGNFQQAQNYFEEALYREPLPEYLYNAAYAALQIQEHEKAHIYLAAYFNLISPMEDPEAWYIFCSLTEKEPIYSVFRDVLISLLKRDSNIKEFGSMKTEVYINDTISLLLKSALYVLQKERKYKVAEPLVTVLQENKSVNIDSDFGSITYLIDLAFKDCSNQMCTEYKRLIGYESPTGFLKDDKSSSIEEFSKPSTINEEPKTVSQDSTSLCENENCNRIEKSKEEFCSKISRKQGQIFKYIAPQRYGFIMGQDGETYFFHVTSIIDGSISEVDLNSVYWGTQIQVIFQPIKGTQGDIAVQISAYHVLNDMLKLAERYADSGDFLKAIEQIEYVLSIDSEYPNSKALLEAWKQKQSEILEEENSLNKWTETESDSIEGWNSKANFLIEHKRYEEALYAHDKVINLTPEFINSLPSKRQLSSFRELYNLNPEYVNVLCKRGFVLYHLGKHKEALEAANQTLEAEPTYVDALSLKASNLLMIQRPQEALELVGIALDLEPKKSELLFLKGKILLKLYKYEEGLEYIEKAYQLTPKNPEILLIKGHALSKLERFEEALKMYNKLIDLQPDNKKAVFSKGFILIMIGRYEEALNLYNGLVQLNPFNSVLWSRKGATLIKLHRLEEALRAIDTAIEIAPDNSESLFTKGYIYSKNGRYEEALKYFDHVLELNPSDQKALAKRALMLSKLGRHPEAFTAIEDALEINWHNSRTWYYKGVVNYNIGKYEEALSAFNKSAYLDPHDTRIEKMRQFTLVKLGKSEREIGVAVSKLKVEEELFDGELEEECDLKFEE